jgi:hypothetical protein
MLRERIKRDGVLQGDDCAPLEVLGLDDLLAMEGACEKHGCGFLALLAEKAAIERPLVPMMEFLANKLRRNAPFPKRVQGAWKAWLDTALGRLRDVANAPDEDVNS